MTTKVSYHSLYRTNSPPPKDPVPPVPFKKGHPHLYKIGVWILGAVVSLIGLWIVTVGAFKLGQLILFSGFHLTWLHPMDATMIPWLTGAGTMVAIPGFYYLSRTIGRTIEEKFGK